MPHHLRYQSAEWALHHVVSRCINGFSFLRPTPAIVQICKGVLGRALAMYSKRIRLIHMAFTKREVRGRILSILGEIRARRVSTQ